MVTDASQLHHQFCGTTCQCHLEPRSASHNLDRAIEDAPFYLDRCEHYDFTMTFSFSVLIITPYIPCISYISCI